ncbi:twin-arginine translocation signal domain-containing protein [Halomonas profundus]|nr:twin-arginine translocation signal domain-containing protein [Halomonas profundus]
MLITRRKFLKRCTALLTIRR